MKPLSRRKFLIYGGGGAVAALAGAGYQVANALYDGRASGSVPRGIAGSTAPGSAGNRNHPNKKIISFAATDGWVSMPDGAKAFPPYFPDVWGPATADNDQLNYDTYVFGFRDVSGLSQDLVSGQKNMTQISAPIIDVNADDEVWITLANLGLAIRPDLTDSHTIHWHGFRNAIPFYDGVPETSISVPIGRQFTYVYRPDDPGTYMYHCHFEDVEHVTMGMSGVVFVRPAPSAYPAAAKNANRNNIVSLVYDDQAVKTGGPVASSPYYFQREYTIILTEIDSRAHFQDAHILATDWTDWRANFWLMNGRAYPDTIAPNAPVDTSGTPANNLNFGKPHRDADGTLTAPAGHPRLKNQPMSSLIYAKPGEKVLLRLVSLGFQEHSLVMPGIPMTIVGSDARPLSPDMRRTTDIVTLGPGESHDVIFTAPPISAPGAKDRYYLYNRDMSRYAGSADDEWLGGQRTHIEVRDTGGGPQLYNNHWDPSWL